METTLVRSRKMDTSELEALKRKRSVVQSSFTKRANKLVSRVDLLGERALIDELRTLEVDYGRVSDAGDDYAEALTAVKGTEDEEEKAKEEAACIEEKTAEYLHKYTETIELI